METKLTSGTNSVRAVNHSTGEIGGMGPDLTEWPDLGINRVFFDGLPLQLAACRAATTANISLSGLQTVDGIALIAGDRVLVKNQTTATQNGIYDVALSTWTRSQDIKYEYFFIRGKFLQIAEGATYAGQWAILTIESGFGLGTSPVTFELVPAYCQTLQPSQGRFYYAKFKHFGLDYLYETYSCKAATTGAITLSGLQTVDGVALVAGDRVLVKNQTTPAPSQYPVYTVSAGAWAKVTPLFVTTDYRTFVSDGNINGGVSFVYDNPTQTPTSTPPIFTRTSVFIYDTMEDAIDEINPIIPVYLRNTFSMNVIYKGSYGDGNRQFVYYARPEIYACEQPLPFVNTYPPTTGPIATHLTLWLPNAYIHIHDRYASDYSSIAATPWFPSTIGDLNIGLTWNGSNAWVSETYVFYGIPGRFVVYATNLIYTVQNGLAGNPYRNIQSSYYPSVSGILQYTVGTIRYSGTSWEVETRTLFSAPYIPRSSINTYLSMQFSFQRSLIKDSETSFYVTSYHPEAFLSSLPDPFNPFLGDARYPYVTPPPVTAPTPTPTPTPARTPKTPFVQTVPSVPFITSVDSVSGSPALIYFEPPLNNGGASITGYEYNIDDGSWLDGANSSPIPVYGLSAGSHTVCLRSVNSIGSGDSACVEMVQAPTITTGLVFVSKTGTATYEGFGLNIASKLYGELSSTGSTSLITFTVNKAGTLIYEYAITEGIGGASGDMTIASVSMGSISGAQRSSSTIDVVAGQTVTLSYSGSALGTFKFVLYLT